MMNSQTATATPLDNTRDDILVPPMITGANNTQQQLQNDNKPGRKRGSRNNVITIAYANDMPFGALEKALADIYVTKIKNGNLDICDI